MKILSLTPSVADGTSWYRSSLPLARLRTDHDVEPVEYGTNMPDWHDMVNFDVLYMQRPHHKMHLKAFNMAITLGLKVWMDFDDLLWKVPPHNPAAPGYSTQEVLTVVDILLRSSLPPYSCISVSTEFLKQEILTINPDARVHVIANALDEKITFPSRSDFKKTTEPFIGWRGSDTHAQDLLCYDGVIRKMISRFNVEFIGMKPFWLGDDIIHTRPGGLLEYFMYLRNTRRWDTFFACFEDVPFNRAKSDIMFLEAFYAGALTVAPDWEEWERPGVVQYSTVGNASMNLFTSIEYVMGLSEQARRSHWNTTFDYVLEQRTLRVTNHLRMDMLDELMSIK